MAFLARREILTMTGTCGISTWLAGMKFIDRTKGKEAAAALNKMVLEMKKNNEKLFVFPEGTRRNTGEIHEFKKGAFHAAILAQVPIIPIVHSSYKTFFDADKKMLKAGKIHVKVLPEISTEGLTNDDVDGLTKKVREIMIETFEQLNVTANLKKRQ
jgi:lysophosphatidate acyltransferase